MTTLEARHESLWLSTDWWAATLFAVGSLGFVIGSALTFTPTQADAELTFAVGTALFVVAGCLELVPRLREVRRRREKRYGPRVPRSWKARIRDSGVRSMIVLISASLWFQASTLAAITHPSTWFDVVLEIWVTTFIGSIGFVWSCAIDLRLELEAGEGITVTAHAWIWFVVGSVGFVIASSIGIISSMVAISWSTLAISVLYIVSSAMFLLGSVLWQVGLARD